MAKRIVKNGDRVINGHKICNLSFFEKERLHRHVSLSTHHIPKAIGPSNNDPISYTGKYAGIDNT